jgi:hypothetical protein
MGGTQRRRRREWRAAGKRKADRMVWWIAIGATLVVIGATLIAGHLRKQEPSASFRSPVSSSDDGP